MELCFGFRTAMCYIMDCVSSHLFFIALFVLELFIFSTHSLSPLLFALGSLGWNPATCNTMFRWLITSIACLAAVQAALTPPAPELGEQLTQASFNETVSSGGVWYVSLLLSAPLELTIVQACRVLFPELYVSQAWLHQPLETRRRRNSRFADPSIKGSHCKRFAPTWEKLLIDKKPLTRLAGFHMAQVNCLVQGGEKRTNRSIPGSHSRHRTFANVPPDLCVDNGITGCEFILPPNGQRFPSTFTDLHLSDPQINLYVDGQFEEEYKDDRGYPILSQWIDDKATKYAQEAVLGLDANEEGRATKLPNPEGKVVEVNEDALDMYKADGPVLVDFFAPWCSQ